MALRVVTMTELRLEVLLEPQRTEETVAEVCRRREISRQSFYRFKRRYEAEGAEGLEARSRRPLSSPGQIDVDLEVEICRMRKDHNRWGARRIRTELRRSGTDPPAVSTIHQILRRNHLVADHPRKRPRALKRFEREVPNDLWQIDATRTHLQDGAEAWIVDALDDHARYLLAAQAADGPTEQAAWQTFSAASAEYGLPRQLPTMGCASRGGSTASRWPSSGRCGPWGWRSSTPGPSTPRPLASWNPKSGKPWTPGGPSAIVMAEALQGGR